MERIKSFFAENVTLPPIKLPSDFNLKLLLQNGELISVILIWLIVLFMLLEAYSLLRRVPAAPLAPVYLCYRKAGHNGKDSLYKNRPLRKISTRVGSDIFFKDIPLLGSRHAFCFDIVFENGRYMMYEAGHDPQPLDMNTQFRRGDYNFVLKELIF